MPALKAAQPAPMATPLGQQWRLDVAIAERDAALQRITEQQQVINALRAMCGTHRSNLEELCALIDALDEDSEARTEQLAALFAELDEARARAEASELRAARSDTLLLAALKELELRKLGTTVYA